MGPRTPRIWTIEPATVDRSQRFVAPPTDPGWSPSLFFHSWAPDCPACWFPVRWLGPPRIIKRHYLYQVECVCGTDTIISPFKLCMGGTAEFWRSEGWHGPWDGEL